MMGVPGASHGKEVLRLPPENSKVYTLDEAFDALGFGRTQVLLFFFVGMAWAGDGAEMMLLSYIGPEVKCQWNLSPAQESWITSAVFLGMMGGSFTWGTLSDAYGRRLGFFAPAAFTALFGVISAFSQNYAMLLICRTLVGFGIAGAHVAYTLFMEFLAPAHRGRYLSFIECFWTFGAIFLAGMAWLLLPTEFGWRGLVLAAAVPLFLLILIYPFIKESPHWFVAQGRLADAQDVLAWTARLNGRSLPPGRLGTHAEHDHATGDLEMGAVALKAAPVEEPVAEGVERGPYNAAVELGRGATGAPRDATSSQSASAGERMESVDLGDEGRPSNGFEGQNVGLPGPSLDRGGSDAGPAGQRCRAALDSLSHSVRQMFATRELRVSSPLLACVWIGVALGYYGLILLNVEMHAEQNDECTADDKATIDSSDFEDVFVTSLGELLGFLLSMLLVDVIGRRRCLWLFLFATTLCLLPLLRPAIESGTAPVDIFVLFLTRAFTYAAFIVLYIYTPEVYPTRVRSFAFGIFNAFCRLGGLVAPFVAVDMLEQVSVRSAVLFFLGACVISAALSFALPIETKGRELAEDVTDMKAHRASAPARYLDVGQAGHVSDVGGDIDVDGNGDVHAHNPFLAQSLGPSSKPVTDVPDESSP